MKDGVFTYPAHSRQRRFTPSQRAEEVLESHEDSKDSRRTKIKVLFTLEPVHEAATPCSLTHLIRVNLSLTLLKVC